MSNAISLKDVSLSLLGPSKNGLIPILHDISLEVKQAETVSIVGASGSGKTSLLMVVAGVEKATKGKVRVCETNIECLDEDSLAAFRKHHIGVVFQNFHLIPTMNALENVAMALEFSGHKDAFSLAKQWLDKVGLSHRADHHPDQLSGGEQQRVALARAFSTHPKVLLADEPTGNLDQGNSDMIVDLLFDLQKEYQTTLMLITHDQNLAEKTSRTLKMEDGRLSHAAA